MSPFKLIHNSTGRMLVLLFILCLVGLSCRQDVQSSKSDPDDDALSTSQATDTAVEDTAIEDRPVNDTAGEPAVPAAESETSRATAVETSTVSGEPAKSGPPKLQLLEDAPEVDANQPVTEEILAQLSPLPSQELDELEPVVADQIRLAREAFDQLLTGTDAAAAVSRANLAEAHINLGQLYHLYGFHFAAQTCYQIAGQLCPQDYRWLHLQGILAADSNRLDDAPEWFRVALKRNPQSAASAFRLGDSYLQLNRLEEARQTLEQTLEIDPKSAAAHARLGDLLSIQKKYDQAIPYYLSALKISPAANRLHYSLALAYRNTGDKVHAEKHMKLRGQVGTGQKDVLQNQIEQQKTGERIHMLIGLAAYRAGRLRMAAEAFAEAVKANPDSVKARINLGTVLGALRKNEEAIEQYQAAVKIDDSNVTARYNLAVILKRIKKHDEAIAHLEFVTKQRPRDLDAIRQLAIALEMTGRLDDAAEILKAARKWAPDDELTMLSLSNILLQQERTQQAFDLLEEYHRRLPDRGLTALQLAGVLLTSPDESLRDAPRGLRLAIAVVRERQTVETLRMLAIAMGENDQCDKAAGIQQQVIELARKAGQPEAFREILEVEQLRYDSGTPCRRPATQTAE